MKVDNPPSLSYISLSREIKQIVFPLKQLKVTDVVPETISITINRNSDVDQAVTIIAHESVIKKEYTDTSTVRYHLAKLLSDHSAGVHIHHFMRTPPKKKPQQTNNHQLDILYNNMEQGYSDLAAVFRSPHVRMNGVNTKERFSEIINSLTKEKKLICPPSLISLFELSKVTLEQTLIHKDLM